MYLKDVKSGDLVEVLDIKSMADPFKKAIQGRFHVGEELQDPMEFAKTDLTFPSDEPLPQCWLDPNYKKI